METKLLEGRLDYMKVVGDTSHFNHGQDLTYFRLKNYFRSTWKMDLYQKGRTLKFMTHPCDRIIVVTFSKKRGNIKGNTMEVEFPGSYLYGDMNKREFEIRAFITKLWSDLRIEEVPYSTMFDMCIDRLGGTFGTHGVKLNDKKYEVKHRRSSNFKYDCQPFFMNKEDIEEQTGQVVYASRFDAKWYDRIFALKARYNTHKYKNYADWYWRLYKDYQRVLRFEVKFKKELCQMFNILFWHHRMPLEKVIPKCMALFYKNHKFIHSKSGRTIKRMDELFKKENLLTIKEYEALANIYNDNELKFKCPNYDDKMLIGQLSRQLFSTGSISDSDLVQTTLRTRKALRTEIEGFILELQERLIRELKLSPPETHDLITERYNKELKSLKKLKSQIPENVEQMKHEWIKAINQLTDKDYLKS